MKRSLTILSLSAAITAALVIADTGIAQTPTPKTTPTAPRHIILPNRKDTLPYSDAVLVGDTLYLAGRIGIDPKTGKVPEKIEDEIKVLLDGEKEVLAQAGMTMDDLVYVQIACTGLSLFQKFNPIYASYFSTKDYPAREFIGAGSLLAGGHFELQAIAVKR